MKRKPEIDQHYLRHTLKRHEASASQTTGETTPESASDRTFDVFLSFRGPDSRHTVADVLYRSLTNSGVRVFLDDEEIRKGEVIEGELLGAIINSRIYIPIFSNDYASSKWCLRELAKMIDCWEASVGDGKKVILPIFYDVDVSEDIKLRSQVYTTALQKHKDELGEVVIDPWEDALRKVARFKGWNLKDHGLSELVDLIIEEVFNKLTASKALQRVHDRLVGIDKPLEDIMELLEEGSPNVRYIVIHGMGGIGKTTLAEAVFKKISPRFRGSCFLRDVRQSSSVHDIINLQEKLLIDTLNLKSINVSDTDDGVGKISERLHNQKVLIVLDDVDKRDHLLNLAAKSCWFATNSIIIITTRTIEFLQATESNEYCFYEMKLMDHGHALQLFCRHAFEKDYPPPEYREISTKIVATTGGLPLALQVIGSSLYNQGMGTWKFRLEMLKEAPHKDVQKILMISYQALEYPQQQIFLDVACLFNGENKTDPIYFWEACKYYPESGIEILVQRSLIKVDDHDKLWMHDQLRDLGRVIAQSNLIEGQIPGKHSRLWSPEYALAALRNKEISQSIIALNLKKPDADWSLVAEEFAPIVNLQFLQLQRGHFMGDFKNVLQRLRWLSWFGCPLRLEVTNLSFKSLVILKLSQSRITEDWRGWGALKEAKNLKVLHLEDCKCLKKTPEFSTFMGLERLILRDCSKLKAVDRSINKLKHLGYLEISNPRYKPCTVPIFGDVRVQARPNIPARPKLLPDFIGGLKSLMELKIENAGLAKLHPSVGELQNMKLLSLRCPQLKILPGSIGKLKFLEELDLSESRVKELPDSIGDLKQLKILKMHNCDIESLPDIIGKLESLEELDLSKTEISELPKTVGNLKRLKMINVSYSKINKLPEALVNLENLEKLEAACCRQMDGNLPEEIGKLYRLRILNVQNTTINRVPAALSQLSHLQELYLKGTHDLQELSKLPLNLVESTVKSSSLESQQVSFLSNMTNLVSLSLSNGGDNDFDWTSSPCIQTPQVKWLDRLPKLESLMLDISDLMSSPMELSSLSRLRWLWIRCSDPRSLTSIPSSLQSLNLSYVKSPIDCQFLSCLNNLLFLGLHNCWLREIKIDCLNQLLLLSLGNCKFLEKVSNLSSSKDLCSLNVRGCPHLVDIEGLGELKSLQLLEFSRCDSIQRFPDLSRLKKLEFMCFEYCGSLESIPNVDDDKENPCRLKLLNCKQFRDFDGPYLERRRAIIKPL